MQIIPVIDIRNGIAVRAVAGRRSEYRAIESLLTNSAEPAVVLKALHDRFSFEYCYVADLDAIERSQLNRCTIAEMSRTGVSPIVDAGVTTVEQIESLFEIGVQKVVLSSESIDSMSRIAMLTSQFPPESLVFSIDLRQGQLVANDPEWFGRLPIDLVRYVTARGIQELIVLDLAAVGSGNGIPTLPLCQNIKHTSPTIKIISGGGVNSNHCIKAASDAGLDGLLIASALHDGRLSGDDICEQC